MSRPDPKAAHRASRHLPIAGRLTGENDDALLRKFRDCRVLLTGDPNRLRTGTGRLILRTAANLIARFSESIDINLGTGLEEFEADVGRLLVAIDSRIGVRKPAPGPELAICSRNVIGCAAELAAPGMNMPTVASGAVE